MSTNNLRMKKKTINNLIQMVNINLMIIVVNTTNKIKKPAKKYIMMMNNQMKTMIIMRYQTM